jgi:hypothetical protein
MIKKTTNGYASTPTALVSFNGTDGANPADGLIHDAAGNLFGTTKAGGVQGAMAKCSKSKRPAPATRPKSNDAGRL